MLVVSEQKRLENIEASIRRDYPDMLPYEAHGGAWHICAGGPSLRDEIKKIKKQKGVIVSVNGTHDYLLSKGIKPHYFIMCDAQPHNARFVKRPRKGITYLIAADCDPSVFDNLEGFDCRIWYPMGYDLPVPVEIGGGTTVGLRAINIGYTLGYRHIHLWGFDGCVKKSHHAYPQKENDREEVQTVRFRGKDYLMTEWQCAQAHNFEELLQQEFDFRLSVHSNGVIKHIGENYAS